MALRELKWQIKEVRKEGEREGRKEGRVEGWKERSRKIEVEKCVVSYY